MGSELLSQPLNLDLCWPSLCSQPLKEQMTKGQLVAGGLGAGRALGTLSYMESGVRTRVQPLGEVG